VRTPPTGGWPGGPRRRPLDAVQDRPLKGGLTGILLVTVAAGVVVATSALIVAVVVWLVG
jgi:hypothetical protein